MKSAGVVIAGAVSLEIGRSYRLDSLIDSFWARALHSDVFPVPGGPECGQTKRDSHYFLFQCNNNHCRNSLLKHLP